MKIIRVFSRLNIGGPSIHVINLTKGLKTLGYKTELVIGESEVWEGDMMEYANQQKVIPLKVKTFGASISVLNDLRTLLMLYKLFRSEKPDIVHTHTFKAGVLGRVAAYLAGVEVIVHTYHGHLLNHYWPKWKVNILKFIESTLSFITNHHIAVSNQVREDLIEAKVIAADKISAISLGFDIDYLMHEMKQPSNLKSRLGLSESAILIGTACRLVPIKNIELLIEASVPILNKYPDVHLVIIGEGPEKEMLIKFAKEAINVISQIHFIDWIIPFQRQLKDFSLYICSSKNEGTSVSVIEAMVAKIPVISTSVGGMKDLLLNGERGQLVESEKPLELQKAIQCHVDFIKTSDHKNKDLFYSKLDQVSDSVKNQFDCRRLYEEIDVLYKGLYQKHKT